MGEGDIRVMIPDLLFKGLHNLMEEDRDACFLYLDKFTNQAKKGQTCLLNFSAYVRSGVNSRSHLQK